jgi:hypothetical protein
MVDGEFSIMLNQCPCRGNAPIDVAWLLQF